MAFVVPDPGRPSPGTPIGRLARLLKPGRASPAPTKLRGESLSCYCFNCVILHYHRMFTRQHSATRVFFAILILTLSLAPFSVARAKKKPPAHPININTASSSDL
jgi:hypothetical protein